MNEEHKARYNRAIIRLLPLLDIMHPDARGTILIHGAPEDTETYAEIAQAFDFKLTRSETSEEFCHQIKDNHHVLLIMIISDVIDQLMRESLIEVCRNSNPIYVLHITDKEGNVPGSDLRFKVFIHHKNILPVDASVGRVMQETLKLIKQSSEDSINHGLIPDYLQNL